MSPRVHVQPVRTADIARLGLEGKLTVSGVGLLFTVVFGLLMPWWLFLVFLIVLGPMFYRLLRL